MCADPTCPEAQTARLIVAAAATRVPVWDERREALMDDAVARHIDPATDPYGDGHGR